MKQQLPKTQRQLSLYNEVSDIQSKRLLTKIFSGCYVAMLAALIYLAIFESAWENTAILGAVQATLTLAIPTMMRHYFPTRNSKKTAG